MDPVRSRGRSCNGKENDIIIDRDLLLNGMDPETKELLEKTLKVAKENNELLHSVRRVQRQRFYWGIFKIVLLIAVSLGAAIYLQPFFEKAVEVINGLSGTNAIDKASLQDLLKNLK